MSELLELAIRIAHEAHAGAVRRGGSIPYIEHPKDVAGRLPEDLDLQVIAWLHDVLEESTETVHSLVEKGIPRPLAQEIELLTKSENQTYEDYIERISESTTATKVKVADILSNLSGQPTTRQILKYSRALLRLLGPPTDDNGDPDGIHHPTVAGTPSQPRSRPGEFGNDPASPTSAAFLGETLTVVGDAPTTSSSAPSPPRNAMVVDCGTGETKILFYELEGGDIKLTEIEKMSPASSYIDEPEAFIKSIKRHIDAHRAQEILICASAWLRQAEPRLLTAGNALLVQLRDSGVDLEVLQPRDECWYELISAEYAANHLQWPLGGLWASGAGSTQIADGYETVYSFAIGNARGRELVYSRGREGLEAWRSEVRNFFLDTELEIRGKVLGISAVSHAAVAAGLPLDTFVGYHDVLYRFSEFIEQTQAQRDLSRDDARSLANVAQHYETLQLFFDENTELFFSRDLMIGRHRMRITWSCGWFLQTLNPSEVAHWPQHSIAGYQKDRYQRRLQAADLGSATEHVNVPPSAVGHVLLDTEQASELVRVRAMAVERLVGPLLAEANHSANTTLAGLEFKFKSAVSLRRKLKSRLRALLLKNSSLPLYYPRVQDVFNEVDDSLRYTVLATESRYSEAIIDILDELHSHLGCTANIVDFWELNIPYCGVHAYVTYQDPPKPEFTFEIQFHTRRSWETKEVDSHEIYEAVRMLPDGKSKDILVGEMQRLWSEVERPSTQGLPSHFPPLPPST